MKKILAKILSVTLVLVMVMCLVPPVEAAASTKKPYYPTTLHYRYYPKNKAASKQSWSFGSYKTNYKITNLKSSNKKVATVSKTYKDNFTKLNLTMKKAGTTTISFNVKIGSKTHKYKTKLTVTKYTPPLKSLKIGSTNLTSKTNKIDTINLGGKKTYKGKLNISLKKGWEIYSINFFNTKGTMSKKKNKGSVTLKKGCDLFINCRNPKTRQWETIHIRNR